ncbi:metalloregulator ArsR/SmtB family transcription factor [Neobacillus sp. PS3-40]|uniref:ArsR/SmtB family transcription factor n=1 Tax=Neobacillus sp. PS3-40 TaxID=3070679 RepID=UPI0027E1B8DB|nr:metalloregulator ArsR/SmtB family transcription factor [Neobacillus sp. PS3-40]WML43189.1 metalloregulator ArsR/SmtB family transcription factor [Neobacillus sp. PS3-40]
MEKINPLTDLSLSATFSEYEMKFKALADQKRLQILNLLCQQDSICVCDLSGMIGMPQSKLSYHLKILLDANLILKEAQGTWSYYKINQHEVHHLLSPQLCCLFRPNCC